MKPAVALVTGATRGAGKGIAIGLASAGMTVYVTGRSATKATAKLKSETLPGTLDETVKAIDAAGGTATVTATDVAASNGVIHVIDTVLMPQ